MNPIEGHFGEVQDLAVTGSDCRDWKTAGRALLDTIRWRKQYAAPKAHKVKRLIGSRR